mgnify:CR=1 FL=1|tara:strand:+ start:201 stop:632 length:432 start_codon:yes stop_codon:yes gene_type:complete
MKITKEQLKEIIKEEVSRLQEKKTILDRKKEKNDREKVYEYLYLFLKELKRQPKSIKLKLTKYIVNELRILNEKVTKEQIQQIIQKHNKDFDKVADELWNNHELEIDVYDGHRSESGYFNIVNISGDKVTSGQVEDEEITSLG